MDNFNTKVVVVDSTECAQSLFIRTFINIGIELGTIQDPAGNEKLPKKAAS